MGTNGVCQGHHNLSNAADRLFDPTKLKPRHIFQLQLVVELMLSSKHWAASVDTPAIDCYWLTHSTLAWDCANDVLEVKATRDCWIGSTEMLIKLSKEDRERRDEELWGAPINHLDVLMDDATRCGTSCLSLKVAAEDGLPTSCPQKALPTE